MSNSAPSRRRRRIPGFGLIEPSGTGQFMVFVCLAVALTMQRVWYDSGLFWLGSLAGAAGIAGSFFQFAGVRGWRFALGTLAGLTGALVFMQFAISVVN